MSYPYVTVSSDTASVTESLLQHKWLSRALKIREVAVAGSCSVGSHTDVKKLTDAPDILVTMCNSSFVMRVLLAISHEAIVFLEAQRNVHVVFR